MLMRKWGMEEVMEWSRAFDCLVLVDCSFISLVIEWNAGSESVFKCCIIMHGERWTYGGWIREINGVGERVVVDYTYIHSA